jgi:hypothetical protein
LGRNRKQLDADALDGRPLGQTADPFGPGSQSYDVTIHGGKLVLGMDHDSAAGGRK